MNEGPGEVKYIVFEIRELKKNNNNKEKRKNCENEHFNNFPVLTTLSYFEDSHILTIGMKTDSGLVAYCHGNAKCMGAMSDAGQPAQSLYTKGLSPLCDIVTKERMQFACAELAVTGSTVCLSNPGSSSCLFS